MNSAKILYVCSEVTPYLPDEGVVANTCRYLPQAMQEMGYEIRLFTPRYGSINERRNQLHEVIRLSGMNLIIDDTDHQLIIKVASIPGARLQVYFIDNDDYFQRKSTVKDEEGIYFGDNDERAIFFARGVMETVKKLRWSPSVIHCHGWMSAIVPAYLKRIFKDDPIFSKAKVLISLYGDDFEGMMSPALKAKLKEEGVRATEMGALSEPTYDNLMRFALQYADGVVMETPDVNTALVEYISGLDKPVLQYEQRETNDFQYYGDFYEQILSKK
ncbi:MAG: glycogen/starch synthase [Mucinivorans sp.]